MLGSAETQTAIAGRTLSKDHLEVFGILLGMGFPEGSRDATQRQNLAGVAAEFPPHQPAIQPLHHPAAQGHHGDRQNVGQGGQA